MLAEVFEHVEEVRAEDAGRDAERERAQHRARPDALALSEPDREPQGDEDVRRPNYRVGADGPDQREPDEGQHGLRLR